MYGLDLSADISATIKKTPRKYASMRSTRGRFEQNYKPTNTAALPFYDTGRYTSLASSVANSPRKMSSIRSKTERFPEHGFMQKYYDKTRLMRQNKVYNTDVGRGQSMVTKCRNSPRTYGLKSQTNRFSRKNVDVPYGPANSHLDQSLGPGSYNKAEEVNTSTGRYLSTVGSVLMSPRHYSTFKSKSPRVSGSMFSKRAAGGGTMWPPMKARSRAR
jgi:hypothetical protein